MESRIWFATAGVEDWAKSLQKPVAPVSFSRRPTTAMNNVYNQLFVFRDIMEVILSYQHDEYDTEKIFYSSLSSLCTISDCICRKLCGLLMVISLDCTKIELFGEGNLKPSSSNEPKDKTSSSARKKKSKNRGVKKVNPLPKSGVDEPSLDKPLKVFLL